MAARSNPKTKAKAGAEAQQRPAEVKKRVNMHEGIPDWYDCCSCEAEPYWVAVAEELGIDLSDHQDADEMP